MDPPSSLLWPPFLTDPWRSRMQVSLIGEERCVKRVCLGLSFLSSAILLWVGLWGGVHVCVRMVAHFSPISFLVVNRRDKPKSLCDGKRSFFTPSAYVTINQIQIKHERPSFFTIKYDFAFLVYVTQSLQS